MSWFEVDKEGLSKLIEKRKSTIIFELIQNCWDQKITKTEATITPLNGPYAQLTVKDDDPNGFSDLTHAFTLFAHSEKRNNPEKRGRFNLGEKLVLSICTDATITSTTGQIVFDSNGRRSTKKKTDTGSEFSGRIRITRDEINELLEKASSLIPPNNIVTILNGKNIPHRTPIVEFEDILPTEIADQDGYLRKTSRKTLIQIFQPLEGEIASIYEMGIPIVETGDKYHINIMQKVPLNVDRDNVTPAYLQAIRVMTLNKVHDKLVGDEANSDWVRSATSDERCSDKAINKALDLRFGEKRVSYDPTDPEANLKAVSYGYTLITGRQMSKTEWTNAKRANSVLPAGQVTPAKPVFSGIAPYFENLTDGMIEVQKYTQMLAKELMNVRLTVKFLDNKGGSINATYERINDESGILVYYVNNLGKDWFRLDNMDVDCLIIHEFGHQYSDNHLSHEYHDALCMLAAKFKRLALTKKELFW